MIESVIVSALGEDYTVRQYVDPTWPGPIQVISVPRVYALVLPQKPTFPALTYTRVSTFSRELHHAGAAGIAEARFQFACFASDLATAKNLASAVRGVFHGKHLTDNVQVIWRGRVVNELDLFDVDLNFQVVVDVIFAYKE